MSVYSKVVDVSGIASYAAATAPDVTIPFNPKRITVILHDFTDQAYVSFDGVNDAALMVPGTPSAGLVFEQRIVKIWLKRQAAGVAPTNVQIIAED